MCKKKTKKTKCHVNTHAYEKRKIDINAYVQAALQKLQMPQLPGLVKGVKGTWNKDHICENIAKGILRAKHQLTVNKDGTIRYDMTQLPCTHFKPKEIGTSVEKLRSLGYEKDINNKELQNEDQVLELKPQDIILPDCPQTPNELASDILIKICNFTDELLEKFYELPRYYYVKSREDLAGHLVIGLAPHTSCGTTCRIIGFSKSQGIYAHPYMHAAMRRNCDGDETCIMLALDAFLNFSRQYLPDRRGGRSMDAPLVLNTILVPGEVDTEAHGLDIATSYPIEFYLAAQEYKYPWEVKVEQVKHRLDTEGQYENFNYTHFVEDMNAGTVCSSYKTLPTMLEKLAGQLELATKIRAVDIEKVATLVIDKHFLRDIKGNLRNFTTQGFRCVACNAKYRRTPMLGMCTSCGGKLIFTVAEGTITKYLESALKLADIPKMPPYIKQTLDLLKRRIDSIFAKEATKQIALQGFMT
jgi:DNA polymerase II large subunit